MMLLLHFLVSIHVCCSLKRIDLGVDDKLIRFGPSRIQSDQSKVGAIEFAIFGSGSGHKIVGHYGVDVPKPYSAGLYYTQCKDTECMDKAHNN